MYIKRSPSTKTIFRKMVSYAEFISSIYLIKKKLKLVKN